MIARPFGPSASLDADQFHLGILDQRIEHARRIAAAAHAGHDHLGQAAELLQALGPGLAADDRLEVANDPRKRMRPDHGADTEMGRFDAAHPIAEGLVHGVAQGPRTAGHRPDFRPEELHAEDIGPLAADVFFAHVDDALQAKMGAGRGDGHAMLPGARLGDDPPLAHAEREQGLAKRVVDLVGPGMVKVLALQINPRSAAVLRQAVGEVQRRRPADIVLIQLVEFGLESRIGRSPSVLDRQFVQARVRVSGTKRPPNWPKRPAASGTRVVASIGGVSSGCFRVHYNHRDARLACLGGMNRKLRRKMGCPDVVVAGRVCPFDKYVICNQYMANSAQDADAAFFNLMHHFLAASHKGEDGGDRDQPYNMRSESRHAFQHTQWIAPGYCWDVPPESAWINVLCHDLAQGGFSFFLDEKPTFERLVAKFDSAESIYVAARELLAASAGRQSGWHYRAQYPLARCAIDRLPDGIQVPRRLPVPATIHALRAWLLPLARRCIMDSRIQT